MLKKVTDGSGEPVFSLFICHRQRKAVLRCEQGPHVLCVHIQGRYAKLLILLQKAGEEDINLPEDLRGFRHAEILAAAQEPNPNVTPMRTTTVVAYLSELDTLLTTTPDGSKRDIPMLVDRQPLFGARLLHPINIIYVGGGTPIPPDPVA